MFLLLNCGAICHAQVRPSRTILVAAAMPEVKSMQVLPDQDHRDRFEIVATVKYAKQKGTRKVTGTAHGFGPYFTTEGVEAAKAKFAAHLSKQGGGTGGLRLMQFF